MRPAHFPALWRSWVGMLLAYWQKRRIFCTPSLSQQSWCKIGRWAHFGSGVYLQRASIPALYVNQFYLAKKLKYELVLRGSSASEKLDDVSIIRDGKVRRYLHHSWGKREMIFPYAIDRAPRQVAMWTLNATNLVTELQSYRLYYRRRWHQSYSLSVMTVMCAVVFSSVHVMAARVRSRVQ